MNAADEFEHDVAEEIKEQREDADYQGDREAFRKHIEGTGEEEGTTYLF